MLWKKVMPRLSAGRVQSVATRLVVERERERMRFVTAGYWDLVATFDPGSFAARLVALDGDRVAQGRDFGPDGKPKADVVVVDEPSARLRWSTASASARSRCARSTRSPTRAAPTAPFRTSTLQQEASRKLRFTSQTTMRLAQRLYENGYITYMRTDSVTLSDAALAAARAQAARALRARDRRRQRRAATSERHERAGGARGDPPRRGLLPHARRAGAASSAATSSRSTTSSGSARSRRR